MSTSLIKFYDDGTVRTLHNEALCTVLSALGNPRIRRFSTVEYSNRIGKWIARRWFRVIHVGDTRQECIDMEHKYWNERK